MYPGKYIDVTTDFGFKRLFGQEDSKPVLKSFLEDILALPYPIQELTYITQEQLPPSPEDRTGIYDIYCVDTSGRRFIVEMQRNRQLHFKDRIVYYSTFPITQQARKGPEWGFNLLPIYCIAILSFDLDDTPGYIQRVQLMNVETKTVFYTKLTLVFIELPKFTLTEEQLTNDTEKWIFFLRNLSELQRIPENLRDEPFPDAFAIAEHAALSPAEQWQYEGSLKRARDAYAEVETALVEGRAEGRAEGIEAGRAEGRAEGIEAGRAEGRAEGREEGIAAGREEGIAAGREEGEKEAARRIARTLLAQGLTPEMVTQVTGLSAADINVLVADQT